MLITDIKGTVELNNGVNMRTLTWGFPDEEGNEVINAVKWALDAGYDTSILPHYTEMKKALAKQ
jgi:diketogulonate reductase-like aldo/keto reductase